MTVKQMTKADRDAFFGHVDKAKNILVITHKELDHDAISSGLLLTYILKKYCKRETAFIVQENEPPTFSRVEIPGIENIITIPPGKTIETDPYDLIIAVDASDLERCITSSEPHEAILSKTIAIDHHLTDPKGKLLLQINEFRSSAVEQVFALFDSEIDDLDQDLTVAKLVQIGIVADTNRFMFEEIMSRETFEIFGRLFESHPINIEHLYYSLIKNTRNSLYVFKHLIENAVFKYDLVYSFVDPDFIKEKKYTETDEESARSMFLQFYTRTIKGTNWGFIVRKSTSSGMWKVSFRAVTGTKVVREIAEKLDGGGHTYAAGARFEAASADDAVQKVLKAAKVR